MWRASTAFAAMAFAVAVFLPPAATGLAQAPEVKPPAQFKTEGEFTGGVLTEGLTMNGVRFGAHEDYLRMVLDFGSAQAHPGYTVRYEQYPYRIVIRLAGVKFTKDAEITSKPALPFSVVATKDGIIKEMQIFLSGPCEFKVIEIDDPAKLSIDVRKRNEQIPTVYSVQLQDEFSAEQAYALVERGEFPAGYQPQVVVLGDVVIVEQVFADPASAAEVDLSLREMGYSSIINERRGNELP